MKIDKYLLAMVIGASPVAAFGDDENSPWPTSVGDDVTLTAEQRVFLPVLDNDIGDELVLFDVNTTTLALGSVEMTSDKKAVYYQSANGYVGEDSFWYAFEDNQGRTNAAKVTLSVLPSDSPALPEPIEEIEDPYAGWPVATPDILTVTRDETVSIPVLENDSGLDLVITAINEVTVQNGSAQILGESIQYTPYQGFTGEDSFWYQFTDARGRANSTQVKLTVSEATVEPPVVIEEPPVDPVEPVPALSFNAVKMHNNLLHRQSSIYGEKEGVYFMSLAEPSAAGASSLLLADDYEVKDGQLVTYLATDGEYYTVATDSLNARLLTLKTPLPADVEGNIWNFYQDGAHPNWHGYLSIADFAIRELNVETLDSGKHLMLGDSWFQSNGIEQRLSERLTNATFVNKGVGGRKASDILAHFDADVENESPNFVWVIAGTNDYFQETSLEEYSENMQLIIEKINNIGAEAIIIDSSVAPLMYGSERLTNLSHRYADAIGELLVTEN